MYLALYNLAMHIFEASMALVSAFNTKIKKGYLGRKHMFKRLKEELGDKRDIAWFHAASLGEAEQGVPIIEAFRKKYPKKAILLTFFSPSGMEHFKKREIADHIFYLPLDTRKNAMRFLDIVKPSLAFFIKYEIWPNFFREIQKRNIPMIIAPAVFLPQFFYFKPLHRNFFLPILRKADRIMVQDKNSKLLLEKHAVKNVSICGDSRFDRVKQNVESPFVDDVLERFTKDNIILIGGSTWPAGEAILREIKERNRELKLIVAPHDIKKENIERILKFFGKDRSFRYSNPPEKPENFEICVIDNIGLLSRLYRYGNIAYIGGGFGKGIHNSLEAAAYGLPLFFGPNHHAFIEPAQMLKEGFAFEIHNAEDMQQALLPLIKDREERSKLSRAAKSYVGQNSGSVDKIMAEVVEVL